jgi:hypothetical protein
MGSANVPLTRPNTGEASRVSGSCNSRAISPDEIRVSLLHGSSGDGIELTHRRQSRGPFGGEVVGRLHRQRGRSGRGRRRTSRRHRAESASWAKASARSVGPPSSRRRWAASSRRSLSLRLIWPSAPRSCRASTAPPGRLPVRRRSRTAPAGARGRRPARAHAHVGPVPFPHVRECLPSVCDGVPGVGHLVAAVCDEVALRGRPAAVIVGQVAGHRVRSLLDLLDRPAYE